MLDRTGGFIKIPEEPVLRLLAPPPLRLAIAMLAFKLGVRAARAADALNANLKRRVASAYSDVPPASLADPRQL